MAKPQRSPRVVTMKKNLWLVPALVSLVFLAFSIRVIAAEGLFGFLDDHLRSGWGMQVGIDLVLAASTGMFLASGLARKYGVRPLPWILLTLATGSIGLLAFVARILYARENAAASPATDSSTPVTS